VEDFSLRGYAPCAHKGKAMGEDREQDRARAWLALSLAHTFLHTSTRCTQNKRKGIPLWLGIGIP